MNEMNEMGTTRTMKPVREITRPGVATSLAAMQKSQIPVTQAPQIPQEALQLIAQGRPAIVMVDDGTQNFCHAQGLSLPAIVGLLTIQLKAWKNKAVPR